MELYCEVIFVECKRTRSECLSGLVAVTGRSDEVNEAIDKKNEQKERQVKLRFKEYTKKSLILAQDER